jgi:hypothetical protein
MIMVRRVSLPSFKLKSRLRRGLRVRRHGASGFPSKFNSVARQLEVKLTVTVATAGPGGAAGGPADRRRRRRAERLPSRLRPGISVQPDSSARAPIPSAHSSHESSESSSVTGWAGHGPFGIGVTGPRAGPQAEFSGRRAVPPLPDSEAARQTRRLGSASRTHSCLPAKPTS